MKENIRLKDVAEGQIVEFIDPSDQSEISGVKTSLVPSNPEMVVVELQIGTQPHPTQKEFPGDLLVTEWDNGPIYAF